ncbi:hypothetical protein DFH29DRAFT_558473 [Suillus ampliporus]|nr:hypothetical protein DFH29DRAFT_558473 [Suillus ampliporus]
MYDPRDPPRLAGLFILVYIVLSLPQKRPSGGVVVFNQARMSQENVQQDMSGAYEGQKQRASQPQPLPLISLRNDGLPPHADEFGPGHSDVQRPEQSIVTAAQSSFRHNDLLLMDYQGPSLHIALPQVIAEVQRLSDITNELWETTQENMRRVKALEDRVASLERNISELRSRQREEESSESDSDIESESDSDIE